MKDQLDVTCYFISLIYVLNTFRTLVPHRSSCGNSTTQSQAPDDGYINVRNM